MKENSIVYVVSTGAGGTSMLSTEALAAIKKSQIIVGYQKYLDDILPLIAGKEIFSSGMTQEIERCNLALEFAAQGRRVALISNGDANVYGMGALIFELADEKKLFAEVEIVTLPGITSFLAAAALVGAPISQDFAVISLSDRLTPAEKIEKRIAAALVGDFVLAIYNPISRTRKKPFESFLLQLDKKKFSDYPIVIAKNVGRENQKVHIEICKNFIFHWQDFSIDMSTVLIVGNSQSRFIDNGKKILTPRGYLDKYNIIGRRKK